jgi:hypothetical protein
VLWALGQPAAAVGLIGAFVLGLGVRALAQRSCARWLGDRFAVRPDPRTDVDPFCFAYPFDRAALRLNRPSDVLRGVIAPTMAEQLALSVTDRLGILALLVLLLVPVGGMPPLLTVLDWVGAPLMRIWA